MTREEGLKNAGADHALRVPADGRSDLVERTFEVRVDLSPDAVIEKLKLNPAVEWHQEYPNPFFARRPFQAWATEKGVFVRRVEMADKTASPTLQLVMSDAGGETRVAGRFVSNDALTRGLPESSGARWALGLLGLVLMVGATVVTHGGYLFQVVFLAFVCASVGVAARRRARRSLAAHGPALLGVVGSVLIPHEVGDGDSPFRALPARTSR